MQKKPIGVSALVGVLFVAGLAGIAASWGALPRTSGTSPLMAMFSLVWGCTFLAAGVLAWRGSRYAAFAFLAAMGLMLTLCSYIFPNGQLLVRLTSLVTILVGLTGAWYLSRARGRTA